MRFMILIILFDFIHVLHIKRTYCTKNEYFYTHILFTTIYYYKNRDLIITIILSRKSI
jgi:hypothetical protein